MIIYFIVGLIINFFIFKKYDRLAQIINLYDFPDKKLKVHKVKIPLLAGIILIINIFFLIIFFLIFDHELSQIKISKRSCFSIIFFVISFFLLGFFDDKYQIKPEKKFFISILISLVVLSLDKNLLINELKFSFYENSIYLENFKYIFSIFCVVILINALNFYDGINGQSIIFFIINFLFLSIKSQIFILYIFLIFVLFFILYLNLKNKLFMGDNGIYLLSTILIVSLIYEYNVLNSIIHADEIFLLLIIPGYDLLRLSIQRILKGKSAFYGDRNHIHHLLMKRFNLFQTNIILIFLSILPLSLFIFININFFVILFIITIIYLILILKFSIR